MGGLPGSLCGICEYPDGFSPPDWIVLQSSMSAFTMVDCLYDGIDFLWLPNGHLFLSTWSLSNFSGTFLACPVFFLHTNPSSSHCHVYLDVSSGSLLGTGSEVYGPGRVN